MNKMAADMGGGGTTPVQKLAKKRLQIQYGPATGKNTKIHDFMPAGARKQTDKVRRVVSQSKAITDNIDYLLRTVSGKRLGLPGPLKRVTKSIGF